VGKHLIPTDEDVQKIVRYYVTDRYTMGRIHEITGFSEKWVRTTLVKQGVTIRQARGTKPPKLLWLMRQIEHYQALGLSCCAEYYVGLLVRLQR
jgi:hypothetical protein